MPFESYWKKRTPTHWHTSHVKFTLVQEDHMLFFNEYVTFTFTHQDSQTIRTTDRLNLNHFKFNYNSYSIHSFISQRGERWELNQQYWTEPWLFHHHFILFLFTFNILLFSIWYYIKFNNFIHRFRFYL